MDAPTYLEVQNYLNSAGLPAPADGSISDALAAEIAAQAKLVNIPQVDGEPSYTPDLREALFRRVAHNLGVRPLALGFKTELSDTTGLSNRVGGTDAEVWRLELPYRKRPVA